MAFWFESRIELDMLREYKEILTRPAAESRDQIIENVTQGAPDVTPQHQAMGLGSCPAHHSAGAVGGGAEA